VGLGKYFKRLRKKAAPVMSAAGFGFLNPKIKAKGGESPREQVLVNRLRKRQSGEGFSQGEKQEYE
jgi:hypothetical protein